MEFEMRQYYITTENILNSDPNDCILDPSDPIHELKRVAFLDGLGAGEALARYNSRPLPEIKSVDRGRIQREAGIKPGTEAWFKLWFGRENPNEN